MSFLFMILLEENGRQKYFVYTLYFRTVMQESVLFLHLQRRKKIDAARFIDARGDEKLIIIKLSY